MLSLRYDAEAIVSYLFAVGDGFALQALSDPEPRHQRRARRRRRLGPLPARQRVAARRSRRRDASDRPHRRRRVAAAKGWLTSQCVTSMVQTRGVPGAPPPLGPRRLGRWSSSLALPLASHQTDHLTGGGFDVPGSQSKAVSDVAAGATSAREADGIAVLLRGRAGRRRRPSAPRRSAGCAREVAAARRSHPAAGRSRAAPSAQLQRDRHARCCRCAATAPPTS